MAGTRKPTPARRRDAIANDEFAADSGDFGLGADLLLARDPSRPNSRSVGASDAEVIGEDVTFLFDAAAFYTMQSTGDMTLQLTSTGVNGNVDLRIDTPDLFDVDWNAENGNFLIDTEVVLNVAWTSGFDINFDLQATADDCNFTMFAGGEINFTLNATGLCIVTLTGGSANALEIFLNNLPTAAPAGSKQVWSNAGVLTLTA